MDFIKDLKQISQNKMIDAVIQSFFWMMISIVAAYPDLCLDFDTSMFSETTRDAYCQDFVLPILLFLLAFVFDFFFSIKDLSIGQKRGALFKLLTIFLCTLILLFCLISIIPYVWIQFTIFILLWINISLIKGLTVLIPGAEDLIMLKAPINNLNSHISI